jgi:hypothetical protein
MMETNAQHERRAHQRFDLEYTIQLIGQDGDLVVTAMTSNVSDGGCRLPLPDETLPDPGEQVQVNLTVRRNRSGEVEMYTGFGEVLRHQSSGEEGEAEVVVKFRAPMDLKLSDNAAPPPVAL